MGQEMYEQGSHRDKIASFFGADRSHFSFLWLENVGCSMYDRDVIA